MPLVKRKVKHTSDTTFSVIEHETHLYVPPHRIKPSDMIVKPADIPDAMLADLAESYPDEFASHARKRNLDVGISPGAFGALSQQQAIETLKTAPQARLASYFDTELSRVPRRPAVIKAFAAKGLTPESFDAEAEPQVDTSDLDDEGGELGG